MDIKEINISYPTQELTLEIPDSLQISDCFVEPEDPPAAKRPKTRVRSLKLFVVAI